MISAKLGKPRKRFKRDCRKCGKVFRPVGRFTKYCDNCRASNNSSHGAKLKGKKVISIVEQSIRRKWKPETLRHYELITKKRKENAIRNH